MLSGGKHRGAGRWLELRNGRVALELEMVRSREALAIQRVVAGRTVWR